MSGLFPAREPTGRWWYDHSLSLALAAILIVQTALAIWTGAYVYGHEQPFGKGSGPWSEGFWMWWVYEYNVSLVADSFGVILIVLLSKWLRERGSSEDTGEQ